MPLVFEISCDIPSEFYPGRCEGFEEYITLKEQTCYDYRHPPDPRRLYIEGQRSIRENTPEVIMYGLQIDDGPLMLEFCLRCAELSLQVVHVCRRCHTKKRMNCRQRVSLSDWRP